MSAEHDSTRGASVYSSTTLAFYDFVVYGFNAPLLWRVKPDHLLDWYNRHVSDTHLDIGVGTGYFLDKCHFPGPSPEICLMDLNENSLRVTAKRISRYSPQTVSGDALQPLPFKDNRFSSVGLNFLLHCMPGDFSYKAGLFDNVARCMAPEGVIFGSTILNLQKNMNWMAKRVFSTFNRRGIFCNQADSPDALRRELEKRFTDVHIDMKGVVALFSGRRKTNSV